MQSQDEAFVFRTWLDSYWPHYPGRIITPKGVFMRKWHEVIEACIRTSTTLVTQIDDEPGALAGFACGTPDVIHWCYVKDPYRNLGIAKNMIEEIEGLSVPVAKCSHWAPCLALSGFLYDPKLLEKIR
jgi:hypothetical protein